MRFELTILGSNSAIPAHGRHPSAQILNVNETLYLIDCGEGTQMQLNKYRIRKSKIKYILISHLHGDHYFGLIGLITTMNLIGRTEPLYIYGPPALEQIIDIQLDVSNLILKYDLNFSPLNMQKPSRIIQNNDLKVEVIPLNHRIPCVGFIFKGNKQPRKYLPEVGLQYDIPVEAIPGIKNGKDFTTESGEVIPNKMLTADPLPPKKFSYITDTSYMESILSKVQRSDLLYHEATFLDELAQRAKETFHTTAIQAATIAKKSRAKRLLIGHYSAKYKELDGLLSEARTVFPDTDLAIEGQRFEV